MQLSTIEMTREEAEAALAEWGEAVKAQKCTDEDRAIAAGYEAIAKGRRLISLRDTLLAGGEDEGYKPRLAVAPSQSSVVFLARSRAGTVAFSTSDKTRRDMWKSELTPDHIEVPRLFPEMPERWGWKEISQLGLWSDWSWKALVPVTPPRFRNRGWKSCCVLFEAEWSRHRPPAPVDPALIQHLRGDLWIVRGVWDLTALERAVLLEHRG